MSASGAAPRFDDALRHRIATNVENHDRYVASDDDARGLRRAAVVIAVAADPSGAAAFVLTRRSPRLKAHTGQLALPGGRIDPGEAATEAGRRELFEEVAISAQATHELGCLDDYVSRSGFVITPVVVWVDDTSTMAPNPGEVDEIMLIGLDNLDLPDSPAWYEIPESDRLVLRLALGDTAIHAPTGAVLWQFREVAIHGRSMRIDHVEEPVWAWR